jgi:hypothetical protein
VEKSLEEVEEPVSPTTRAAPVPLPGFMRPPPPPEPKQQESEDDEEEEESLLKTPHQEPAPSGELTEKPCSQHNADRRSAIDGARSTSSYPWRTPGSAPCPCGLTSAASASSCLCG